MDLSAKLHVVLSDMKVSIKLALSLHGCICGIEHLSFPFWFLSQGHWSVLYILNNTHRGYGGTIKVSKSSEEDRGKEGYGCRRLCGLRRVVVNLMPSSSSQATTCT